MIVKLLYVDWCLFWLDWVMLDICEQQQDPMRKMCCVPDRIMKDK